MKRYFKRLIRRGETGQSIVILAMGFIALLAVVGITTDISLMFARYSQLRRAVDSAAIAAASQIRQDQDIVAATLSAKQFVEFHGLDPTEVEVLTCEMLPEDQRTPELNPAVCTEDRRKLVQVTAWVEPPTIFLSLLGLEIPPLSASAVSETAVLEVVVIMDVSESMLAETTYQDWGEVGLGIAYVPPRLEPPGWTWSSGPAFATSRTLGGTISYPQYHEAVYSRMTTPVRFDLAPATVMNQPGDVIPVLWYDDTNSGIPEFGDYLVTWNDTYPPSSYQPNPNISSAGEYVMDTTKDDYNDWRIWFHQEFHLGVSQEEVNNRLYYLPADDTYTTDPDLTDNTTFPDDVTLGRGPDPRPADIANVFYPVRSFVPDYPGDLEDDLGTQNHPRPECRVRYFPYSINQEVDNGSIFPGYRDEIDRTNDINLLELYSDNGVDWGYWMQDADGNPGNRFSGFVPTYKFYGCCNDPGSPSATGADGDFSDLICEPFKKARDATELFLERIDFSRGDRVAFVTFDRSSFLIDPDGENGPSGPLIDSRPLALATLREDVGVRAEPNFYVWNRLEGSWSHEVSELGGGLRYTGPVYAQGVDRNTGQSIPAYYQLQDWDNGVGWTPVSQTVYGVQTNVNDPESGWNQPPGLQPSDYNDYPVADNCHFWNATINPIFTRSSRRYYDAAETNPSLPIYSPLQDPSVRIPDIATDPNQSYILRAQCRGTNMGAALRTASGALTNSRLGARSEGAVWVMVLLSDGAAGASNPVRATGRKLNSAFPYEYGEGGSTLAEARGEYGAYGLCPMIDGSELVDDIAEAFPYCSDAQFQSRHYCLGGIPGVVQPGGGGGTGNTGFYPNAYDNDFDSSQPPETQLRNVYDVDIGTYDSPGNLCSPLYDVDDYARDWADFVTGIQRADWFSPWVGGSNNNEIRDPSLEVTGGDANLPTIFTIGFGLNFNNGRVGDTPGSCWENVPDCLGEELLRYIADAGDDFEIDNDYQQYLLHEDILIDRGGQFGPPVSALDPPLDLGPAGPCQNPGGWDPENPAIDRIPDDPDEPATLGVQEVIPLDATESCGNYYNAPNQDELEKVFDDIASRMFTRLSG